MRVEPAQHLHGLEQRLAALIRLRAGRTRPRTPDDSRRAFRRFAYRKGIERAIASSQWPFTWRSRAAFASGPAPSTWTKRSCAATVLEPWVQGRRVHLGEKDFEPKDSKLVVLEGPELADVDLSMGRGWSNAEKASRERHPQAGRVRLRSRQARGGDPGGGGRGAGRRWHGMLARLELELAPWDELRSRILGAAAPAGGRRAMRRFSRSVGARPSASWLFDAGLGARRAGWEGAGCPARGQRRSRRSSPDRGHAPRARRGIVGPGAGRPAGRLTASPSGRGCERPLRPSPRPA